MCEKYNLKTAPAVTENQAAFGAALLIGFFVVWFLIEILGMGFIEWIEGKTNLSAWVQALGSILAILGAALFPIIHEKINEGKKNEDKRKVARLYLLRISPVIKGFESDVRSCGYRYVFALTPTKGQEYDINKLFNEFLNWFKLYENFLDASLHAKSFSIVPEIIGQRISLVIGKLQALQLDVMRFDVDFYVKDNDRYTNKLKEWRSELLLMADIIRSVNNEIDSLVEIEGVMPSHEEIHC